MKERRLVWDLPTRFFHWFFASSFIGAYLTGDSERWMLWHVAFGYSMLGLICFRVVWGLVGTRYVLFSEFVTGVSAIVRYLRSLISAKPIHYVGHNPLGALSILILLMLGLLAGFSGLLLYNEVDLAGLESFHELTANLMLLIVFIHILGVLVSSWLHQENLIRAMIDGRKNINAQQAITKKHIKVAWLIVLSLLAFWIAFFEISPYLLTYFSRFLVSKAN